MGICIPQICRDEIASSHLQKYFNIRYKLESLKCVEPVAEQASVIELAVTGLLLIYTASLIIATLMNQESGISAVFSLKKNFKKLIAIRENASNRLECLNGVKVVSMIWIIMHHCHKYLFNTPGAYNYDDYVKWEATLIGNIVVSARLTVDSFFITAAALLTISFMKAREKR